MLDRILRLEKTVAAGARWLAYIGLLGMLFISLSITIDVLARWLFNTPIHGVEDINSILISMVVVSFFPALLIERGNVTLELLGKAVSAGIAEWLNAFGHLITLFFVAVLSWYFVLHGLHVETQVTLIIQLPVAPGWWLTTALMIVCVPVQALVFIVHVLRAATGRLPELEGVEEFG